MKTLLVLLLGALLGIAAYWYYHEPQNKGDLQHAQEKITAGAERMKESITETVGDIRPEDIKAELARSGKVVRKKAREVKAVIADATADARITAAIKGKLAVDPDLSALKISVNTTDGLVTLSGTVSSHEHIAKAMRLALEPEGVAEVVSTLQVK